MPDAPPPFAEAPHGTVPQLVSGGGIVLAAPKFKPIFFAGDSTMQAQVEQFGAMLAGSPYWHATTAEYGVGDITLLPTLVTTDPVPGSDSALNAWIIAQLDGTHSDWGTPDQSTIYSVFLPEGAVLTSPFGNSCQSYGAYHDELTGTHGEHIVYALMPRCNPGPNALTELTASLSHELIEAATDPNVETTFAYGNVDDEHAVWGITPGAETGDFCEYLDAAYQPLVGSFIVQRTWSNAAAQAGHDPCVPQAGTYLGAAPLFTENVTIGGNGNAAQITKGVKVAIGTPKTIDVALFSDAASADFTVTAIDLASSFDGGPKELTFSWDKQKGHNGDTLHLTITRVRAGSFGGSEFLIEAKNATQTTSQWWSYASN
ncbi:MAG: hypothetical protein JWO36_1226 [Myxococcales bacterium]|nr:hypothetical protein [Myxococcales bacterium]